MEAIKIVNERYGHLEPIFASHLNSDILIVRDICTVDTRLFRELDHAGFFCCVYNNIDEDDMYGFKIHILEFRN